jgi:fatty-acyl-CoA synthase
VEVPLLVDDFLNRAARIYPDKEAIIDGEIRLSYREFQYRVHQLANTLLAMGISRGDRVAILSPNSHFFLESFYATSAIGAILVPLNYRLQTSDLQYILGHAGVVCLLADRTLAESAVELRAVAGLHPRSLARAEHRRSRRTIARRRV